MADQTLSINPVGMTFIDTDGNQVGLRLGIDPVNPLHGQVFAVAKDGTEALIQEFEMAGGGRLSSRFTDAAGHDFILTDDSGDITWAG
jgi:hypothetical protein